jgi:hypothetical protein
MDHSLTAFVDDLRSTHRENLVSVILYGSSAAGDHDPRASDYNLLVVLEKITPKDLRDAHAAIREWARLGHNVPVYFTAAEINDAADVFPIEFHQMQVARKVLFGRDVLEGVDISDANLRHQVEFELRSKLIMLRRQYIPASASVDGLVSLLSDSLVSFIALFRGVLMLLAVDPPAGRHTTLALTVEHLKLNGRTFEKVYNIRQSNFADALTEVEANQLFADYLEQLGRVIDAVDALEN